MKKILFFTALCCLIFVAGRAIEDCCFANCTNNYCSSPGGGSSCTCSCDAKGNAHCTGGTGGSVVCANSTQLSNMNGEVTLYQGFKSTAGNTSATILGQIINLFAQNDNYLSDNSQGGDVQQFQKLRASLEAVQLSQAEQASLDNYISNSSLGSPCGK